MVGKPKIGKFRKPRKQDYVFDYLKVGDKCQLWMDGGINVAIVTAKNVGVFKLDKEWIPGSGELPLDMDDIPMLSISFISGPKAGYNRNFKLTELYSYSSFYVWMNGLELAKLIRSGISKTILSRLVDPKYKKIS